MAPGPLPPVAAAQRTPPFVGCEQELRRFSSVLSAVRREGRGGAVWVRGARGMGRSRLMARIAETARATGIATLSTPPDRRPGDPVPILEAIDTFLTGLAPEGFLRYVDAGLLDLLPVFIARDPRLAKRSWAKGLREASALKPDADRLRFHHTFFRFLTLLSAPDGAVLAFDDLDRTDTESREIVRFVSRSIRREAIVIVASTRATQLPPGPESGRRAHLRREAIDLFGIAPALIVETPGLTLADVTKLLAPALHAGIAPADLDVLARAVSVASQGSPLMARVLTALLEPLGMVARRAGEIVLTCPADLAELPRTPREAARAFVRVMPEHRGVLLQALAAFGAPCDIEDLVHVSGLDREAVSREVAEGVAAGILGTYHTAAGAERVLFCLEELRELLLAPIDAAKRQQMHRRIAALLQDAGAPASLVAGHFLEAGDRQDGFRLALQAGTSARRLFHNSEAVDLLSRAVDVAHAPGDAIADGEVAVALENLADVLGHIGRWPEALDYYREATVRCLKADRRAGAARNHRKRGELLEQMGQLDDARQAYERGLALLDGSPETGDEGLREAAELQASLGWLVGHVRGEYGKGIALAESALEIGRRLSDERLQARALNGIGVILNDKGDWAVAVEAYERALRLNEAVGDRIGASSNYNNLAVIFAHRGDPGQAFRYYGKSLKIDRSIGALRGEAIGYNNLGTLCFRMGRWEKSLAYYSRCRAMALQLGDLGLLALAEINTGEARLCQGEFPAAETALRKAAQIQKELGQTESLAGIHASLGQLYLRTGKVDRAQEQLDQATRLAEERDDKVTQAEAALTLAELWLARGDPARAEELCVKASRLAHRLALDELMGEVYCVFGMVKGAAGEPAESLGFLGKALELFRPGKNPYKLARAFHRYGRQLQDSGDDGRPFLEKAREMFEHLGAKHDAARVRELLDAAAPLQKPGA